MREQLRQVVTVAALCVLAVAGYGAVTGGGGPEPAHAAGSQPRAGLHVSGTGTVTAKPDRAQIRFTTSGKAATLAAAQDQASAAMRRVIAAMRAGGVSADDLSTSDVQGGRLRHGGYGEHQSLTVTVREPSSAGALVGAGVAAGADSSSGPDFSVADTRQAYEQALAAAVRQARARADAIAAAAGVRISGIQSIDEGGGYQPQVFAAADSLGPTAVVPTQQGTRQVSASVTVVFATAPA